jgi:hypothetical protein
MREVSGPVGVVQRVEMFDVLNHTAVLEGSDASRLQGPPADAS